MINKKVLMVAPYPIEVPLHGGQKRVKALFDYYSGLFQEVRFIAVFHKNFYDSFGPNDYPIQDLKTIGRINAAPFASDLVCGEAIYDDPAIRQGLVDLLNEYKPDIIQMEQIYPYAGLKQLLQDTPLRPRLILSSQNIESKMKEEIFADLKMPSEEKRQLVKEIRALERDASQQADLVIAVSANDALEHTKLGAKKCLIIPNGIAKIIPTNEAIAHWRAFQKSRAKRKFVTFVGSAHPPNLIGFEKLIGHDLDFLPDDTLLTIAGGISQYMEQEIPKDKPFWRSAVPLGKLSDDNLAGLIQESEVIVLPIISGGGSNLKTAEAILSGKKLVTTHLAFRSYERYASLPNIYFADNRSDFRRAIMDAVNAPTIPRTGREQLLAERVQWQYCLAPLQSSLELMCYGTAGHLLQTIKRWVKSRLNRFTAI